MAQSDIAEYADLYETELLENVIPFWEKHSIDAEQGGYFTCLDREGRVYDTDKFVWLQARQVWTFSMLYNRFEQRADWVDIARCGMEFLAEHGTDREGAWYFALDRGGRPLVRPYNIFSDCFAAMAFAQYALAADDDKARRTASHTFRNILRRKGNPKGQYEKTIAENRPLKSLGLSMILANVAIEMETILSTDSLRAALDMSLGEVMNLFLDKERNLIFENVSPDGSHPDCFEGRLINPGHGIEAMWFIMDIARRRNDSALIEKALDVILSTLEFAWDAEYGGIFYFLDVRKKPPVQLEWNQKLWWVHLESLVALSIGYALTGRSEAADWFRKVHEYAWSRFRDPEYGEWFGYLNRRGERLLDLKGGKWKGCFHVPRGLYMCYNLLSGS